MAVTNDDDTRPTLDDLEQAADTAGVDYYELLTAWAARRRP